jgi:uncharacterized membrane protein YfcA
MGGLFRNWDWTIIWSNRCGGGIFLSPLLLFMGWAKTKQTAGISAAFILVNSIAGISGYLSSVKFLPDTVYLLAIAAALGGIIGSSPGSR